MLILMLRSLRRTFLYQKENVFLIIVYFLGIAYVAVLPPWEGYDETAHYSYAQQVANTDSFPRNGDGRLSLDIEAYQRVAPTPYITFPPFDSSIGGITYKSWFDKPDSDYGAPHLHPVVERTFTPGVGSNWQAQHPRLYYLLISPIVKLTADFSWASQLFILRLVSWTMACLGFFISLMASQYALKNVAPTVKQSVLSVSILWPLLYPEFFPEFARIGNDALVLLLMSLVWALAVRHVLFLQSWWWYLAMGLVLGLGGLTKATFLPVALAIFFWLIWIGLRTENKRDRWFALGGFFVTLCIFLAFAGKWYLSNYLERSSLTGLAELSQQSHSSSIVWFSALQHPIEVFRGLAGMAMTFVWGGSASSAYPPAIFVLPMVVPVLVLLPCAYFAVKKLKINIELPILALLITGAVFGGLFYYLLARIATTGFGAGAPGWYFHVLIGPISLLLGLGWTWFKSRFSFAQLLSRLLIAYSILFSIAITWLQLALFTGCTSKTATSKTYSADEWTCMVDFHTMYDRLSLLANPSIAAAFLYIAISTLCLSAFFKRKSALNTNP